MTELQRLEFEMLKEVLRISKALGVKCYLVCGTALGAVKYQGFIPWDDDIDVGFFREDYEIFCKKAQSMLPEHLFLQNNSTDPEYPMIFSKIRDSRTTYIENSIRNLKINHGVYIDIFPLDYYPLKKSGQLILEAKKWYYTHLLATVYNTKRSLPGEIIRRFNLIIGVDKHIPGIVKKYEKALTKHNSSDPQIVCNHSNWQGKLEYAPIGQYGNGAEASFEGLSALIPEQYDAYLTQKYGDWRSDPPKEAQKGHHLYALMDLNRPYTDYTETSTDPSSG